MIRPEHLVGRSKQGAIDLLKEKGIRYRIVREEIDGENHNYVVTCDYNTKRCNLEIEEGIVVEVYYA